MTKISIFGTGYVGLVAGAGFADVGNTVLCLDVNASKIATLNAGAIPIHQPGLDSMVVRNAAAGRLLFSTDYDDAVKHAEVIFLAVGTPPDEDGSADLTHILAAARSIGQRIARRMVVVDKSTVPVGTADKAVKRADVLVLVTEWKEFRSPDFGDLAATLRAKAVFDGRNIYPPATVAVAGGYYEGIGRTSEAAAAQ